MRTLIVLLAFCAAATMGRICPKTSKLNKYDIQDKLFGKALYSMDIIDQTRM